MAPWFQSGTLCLCRKEKMNEWITKEIAPYSEPPICSSLQLRGSPGALGSRLLEDKKISPFQWWMFLKSSLFFHRWFTGFLHRSALAVYQISTESDCWGRGAFVALPAPCGARALTPPSMCWDQHPAWECPGWLWRRRKGGITVFFSASLISLRWPKLFLSW